MTLPNSVSQATTARIFRVIVTAFPAACLLLALSFAAPSFADAPLRNWPLEGRGEKDANGRAVQLLLTAHGYKVSADGVFGAATQKALRQFQSAHRLVATGETNNPTWEALIVTVHLGSAGPAVRAAQYELRNEGYAVTANGIFDARTKAAVQTFQKQTGHTADSVIGRKTWYELVGGDEAPGD